MLIRFLKRTWFFKKIEKIKNFFWVTLERIEAAMGRIEQKQQARDAALASLAANDTSTLEALLHLVQRAPADNALAESRQAAMLREIRERFEATGAHLTVLGRRLEQVVSRDEQVALCARLDDLERSVASGHEALERAVKAGREGVAMRSDLESLRGRLDEFGRVLGAHREALEGAVAAGREGMVVRTDLDGLRGRLDELGRVLGARYEALERAVAAGREGVAMRSDLDGLRGRLEELWRVQDARHEALERAVAAGRDGMATHSDLESLRGRLDEVGRVLGTRQEAMERAVAGGQEGVATRSDLNALAERLGDHAAKQGEEIRYTADEPELGLIAHIAPLLPRRVAIDIGANVGKYSEALLDAGFEVHAFEPNPPVLEQLRKRLGASKKFTAHGFALGAQDGKLPLRLVQDLSPERYYGDVSLLSTLTTHALPEVLTYDGKVDVPVRTLDGLHREGLLPAKVSYVKVDTEGFDLEVVRGMGSHRYPVVSVEFWDRQMDFGRSGALNDLRDLVAELKSRGYGWWIVLYRVHPDPDEIVRFYSNVARSVERSWGNAFFFRDHALFAEAERWCAAVLPRTYFAATRARNGATSHAVQAKA